MNIINQIPLYRYEKIAREKEENAVVHAKAMHNTTTDWDADPTLLQKLRMMHRLQGAHKPLKKGESLFDKVQVSADLWLVERTNGSRVRAPVV